MLTKADFIASKNTEKNSNIVKYYYNLQFFFQLLTHKILTCQTVSET